MEEGAPRLRTSEVLDLIEDALNRVDHAVRGLDTDGQRLADLGRAVVLAGRLQALGERLAGEAEQGQASLRVHGCGTATWLTRAVNLTGFQARRLVRQGEDQRRFRQVEQAALAGTIRPEQARAITVNLAHLPGGLDQGAWDRAEADLIVQAEVFDSAGLRLLSQHMLEVAAPELADQLEEQRLEDQARQAERDQYLSFCEDGPLLRFSGALPLVDGLALKALVDAEADQQRRCEITSGTWRRRVEPSTRRGMALARLIDRLQHAQVAPGHGGDRPRVVVTMRLADLLDQALKADLIATGDRVDPGRLRRLLCDADVTPVVLGGPSEVLDVGRTQRCVTSALRRALERRDRGCVVPGCDRPPADCEAHHIRPWWAGGATRLDNLVLVCRHHHTMIEPGRHPADRTMTVHIAADGVPEVSRPGQPPGRHQRFTPPLNPAPAKTPIAHTRC